MVYQFPSFHVIKVQKKHDLIFTANVFLAKSDVTKALPDEVFIEHGKLQDAKFLASIGLFGKIRLFKTKDGIFELTDDDLQDQK